MEPAYLAGKYRIPIKTLLVEQGSCLIAAVVEDHRSSKALPTIAVYVGHVGTPYPIMGKAFVERLHSHSPDLTFNLLPHRVVHHRAGNGCSLGECPAEVCSDIVLTPRDMQIKMLSIFEWNNARIKTDYQGSQ